MLQCLNLPDSRHQALYHYPMGMVSRYIPLSTYAPPSMDSAIMA